MPNVTQLPAEPAEAPSPKEILQERAQLVRVYEASCKIAHPTDEESRFRSAIMRKLGTSYNLQEMRRVEVGSAPAPAGKPSTIWLGCEKETIHPQTKEPVGARMHLTRDQVKNLIPMLQNWVDTGSFKKPKTLKRIATKR